MSGEVRVRSATAPLVIALAFGVFAALTTSEVAAQARGNVQAQQSQSLHDRLYSRGLPDTGSYVTSSGVGFVLDRSGPRPLIRFGNSPEIWALHPSSAPRGDVLYRNDAGDLVLRITRSGGLTLYTASEPAGMPASLVGAAPGLRSSALSMNQLAGYLLSQSLAASNAVGHLIEIDVRLVSAGAYAVLPDVVPIAVQAIVRMASSSNLRDEAAQVRIIQIVEGPRAAVAYRAGILRITINPEQGPGGRPSSARIVRALAAS